VFGGPDGANCMTGASDGVLTKRMRLAGWLCLLGVTVVVLELVLFLPHLPARWWHPVQPPFMRGEGMEFDVRAMYVDFGLAWFGSWGYVASFIWLPLALLRVYRGSATGRSPSRGERVILMALPALLVAASALVHLTPLRYATLNIPVL
jgi:hypothetical protein